MINNKHPQYAEHIYDWTLMRDCYKGERAVKDKNTIYLPATHGQELDGMGVGEDGYKSYSAYKTRAIFPGFVYTAVESYLGLLHTKPTVITLPPEMEYLHTKATITGEDLITVLRKIQTEQLITGRIGALMDLREEELIPQPYIALYHAERIINWDDNDPTAGLNALNMVVLDESRMVRSSDFVWRTALKYRILTLGNLFANEPNDANYVYQQSLVDLTTAGGTENTNYDDFITPVIRNNSLQEIPFVFINSKDTATMPDVPPLLSLSTLCLAIYRAEADYRHTLYMQGQDTLVIIAGSSDPDDETRVGAGSKIEVGMGGDAKYIGVSSGGLTEMRSSLENDRVSAQAMSGQLASNKGSQESGDALRLRMASQTANLTQVAIASCYGLERLLKITARWMNLDDSLVTVTPNLQFADNRMTGQDFVQLMQAKSMGLPLSDESLHSLMQAQNLTAMHYDEEAKLSIEEFTKMKELTVKLMPKPVAPVGNPQGNDPQEPKPQDTAKQPPKGKQTNQPNQ
jgi:hypothetical protein